MKKLILVAVCIAGFVLPVSAQNVRDRKMLLGIAVVHVLVIGPPSQVRSVFVISPYDLQTQVELKLRGAAYL